MTTDNFQLVNYLPKNKALLTTRPVLREGEHDGVTFLLPMGRAIFCALEKNFISKKNMEENKKEGKDPRDGASYQISVLLPPEADLSPLKRKAAAMAEATFGKSVGIKMPWVRAEEKKEPKPHGVLSLEGFTLVNANSYKGPVPLRDQKTQPIKLENYNFVYSGAFVIAEVKLATFSNKNNGVKLWLQSVQLVKNGPRLQEDQVMGGESYTEINEEDDDAMDEAFA